MTFIKLHTVALIATLSLTACSSYEQAIISNKTNINKVQNSNPFITSIKPSNSEAIIGQVTDIIDLETAINHSRRDKQATVAAHDGQIYIAIISKSNFGQKNAYQMQEVVIGDYIEIMGEQSQSGNDHKIAVRAMPYVLRQIMVADHKVNCVGVGPQLCLLTKPVGVTNTEADWQYRYSAIEGFNYEPNYEYTLLIKNEPVVNPPADGSSIHSTLIQVIEKRRTKP